MTYWPLEEGRLCREGLWQGRGKTFVRNALCTVARPNLRATLLLPGIDLGCIPRLTEQGSITADTRVVAVERDFDTYSRIRTKLGKQPNLTLWNRELEAYSAQYYLPHDVDNFDFAYCDWCGPLTNRKFAWLRELGQIMESDSVFSTTFMRSSLRLHFLDNTLGQVAWSRARSVLDDCVGGKLLPGLRLRENDFTDTTVRLVAHLRDALRRPFAVLGCFEYNELQLDGYTGGSYMTTIIVQLDQGK